MLYGADCILSDDFDLEASVAEPSGVLRWKAQHRRAQQMAVYTSLADR